MINLCNCSFWKEFLHVLHHIFLGAIFITKRDRPWPSSTPRSTKNGFINALIILVKTCTSPWNCLTVCFLSLISIFHSASSSADFSSLYTYSPNASWYPLNFLLEQHVLRFLANKVLSKFWRFSSILITCDMSKSLSITCHPPNVFLLSSDVSHRGASASL